MLIPRIRLRLDQQLLVICLLTVIFLKLMALQKLIRHERTVFVAKSPFNNPLFRLKYYRRNAVKFAEIKSHILASLNFFKAKSDFRHIFFIPGASTNIIISKAFLQKKILEISC